MAARVATLDAHFIPWQRKQKVTYTQACTLVQEKLVGPGRATGTLSPQGPPQI